MCGIAGIVDLARREISEQDLHRLQASIAHRGPDDAGVHTAPGIGLAAARLAVVDLSDRGHMPMCSADRGRWIVHNGEVYNFVEIRRELEGLGHRFQSSGDTEVILAAFDAWGASCVERFSGMFAFAIWDERTHSLFAARDRLGVKPFFWSRDATRVTFASELHGLYALGAADASQIDPVAMDFYLSHGHVPSDRTLVRGFEKLPPGHTLHIADGVIRTERYWQPRSSAAQPGSLDEHIDAVDVELQSAVRKRLRSDAPLGCFLSGGLDSGLVTAMAAQQTSGRLRTFSVGFEGAARSADERPLARLVAEHYGTDHTEMVVGPGDRKSLPRLLHSCGEPFADVGILPMAEISAAARAHVTVALSGDGGDESFGGYPSVRSAWAAARYRGAVPEPLRRLLERIAGPPIAGASSKRSRIATWLDQFVNGSAVRRLEPSALFGGIRHLAYADGFKRELDSASNQFALPSYEELGLAEQQLLGELSQRLPRYLTKIDIASSRVALEVRSPFLDHAVVELAASLPLSSKIPRGQSKFLLRRIARRYLPAEIVSQPKRGFAPNLSAWLRGDWAPLLQELLAGSDSVSSRWIRPGVIRDMIDQHGRGVADHGERLYALLCLELWWRIFVSRTWSGDETP